MPKAQKNIIVVSRSEIRSGESNGKPWTLYEIVATDAEGNPIDEKLKSFAPLTGNVTVEVEKQVHEKYGTSYMLSPVDRTGGGSNGGLGKAVDELRARVQRLEQRVEQLARESGEQTTTRIGTDDIPF